jgi:NhaC family Na+:H+ antiporter
MIFGGIMEESGMLKVLAEAIIEKVHSVGSLIASTAATCVFFNLTTSDQYLAILVPGRMYADIYRKRGLKPENLSRTLEDSATVTSVLIPWNTCGATQASVLGVATLTYAPYCFFNIISPFMTVLFGYFKLGLTFYSKEEMLEIKKEFAV